MSYWLEYAGLGCVFCSEDAGEAKAEFLKHAARRELGDDWSNSYQLRLRGDGAVIDRHNVLDLSYNRF